jgi:predicted transposase YdaD
MAAYDKYWDSISVERTLLSDSYVEGKAEGKMEGIIEGKMEGKSEGINLMIVNGNKAGISIEILSTMAQISAEEVEVILRTHGLIH